uniref:Uncharacterized protein LOC102802854 n=1 Tax=Saccoglossus kowalevskii TaxID=10224 RepID=A0ABM0M411_SACKO|nr:PREDICTED: uncharacterized protein LOC102802854 [Saccoglossus kowalevskii]
MDRPNWESPGLDMGHGFVEQIRRRQHRNLQDNQTTKNVTVRMSPRCRSTKPTMNFYVPPAARKSEATAQPHKTEVEQSSSYPSHVVMTNPLLDKFKIEKFPAYLQPYIIQALINPAKLGANDMLPIMGYVCKYSIDECHYTLTGSKLCAAIIQVFPRWRPVNVLRTTAAIITRYDRWNPNLNVVQLMLKAQHDCKEWIFFMEQSPVHVYDEFNYSKAANVWSTTKSEGIV